MNNRAVETFIAFNMQKTLEYNFSLSNIALYLKSREIGNPGLVPYNVSKRKGSLQTILQYCYKVTSLHTQKKLDLTCTNTRRQRPALTRDLATHREA